MLSLQRLNLIDFILVFGLDYVNLVSCLLAQPELLGRAKKLCQPDCRISRDPALAQNNVVHPWRRNTNFLRQTVNAQLHGLEKFLFQNLSRMDPPIRCALPYDTHLVLSSVIIHDLHVIRIAIPPIETDSKLIVDPNAVFPFAVSLQLLQTIAWRH